MPEAADVAEARRARRGKAKGSNAGAARKATSRAARKGYMLKARLDNIDIRHFIRVPPLNVW